MTPQSQSENEVARILLASVSGEASEEDLKKLARMLTEDRTLLSFVVDFMNQESWLVWHRIKCSGADIWQDIDREMALLTQSTKLLASARLIPKEDASTLSSIREKKRVGDNRASKANPFTFSKHPFEKRSFLSMAAALLLGVGILLGLLISRWQLGNQVFLREVARSEMPSSSQPTTDYAVRFVRGTACFWNQVEGQPLYADHQFRSGESLNLLQGIAELHFDSPTGFASLQIEGPAGLVLTEGHGANLSHGKFTADVHTAARTFSLDTPAGTIDVPGKSSLGVQIFGGNVELHVFKGIAQLIVPWAAGPEESKLLEVLAGSSVSLTSSEDGRIQIERGRATPANFAAKTSMYADQLVLPKQYESKILEANPLLYWRFEEEDVDRIIDHSGNENHGKLIGLADWTKLESNSSLVLGERVSQEAIGTRIVSERPITADPKKGYSVEVWFKPSHYHWGSLIGMLTHDPLSGELSRHGFALELGGARSTNSEIERPGRIRFLHRNPPTADVSVGTSCFSESSYSLREWQHLVAVKDATQMRLYVNGELSCSEKDETSLADDLHLILGQLNEHQFYRRFVGQVDELVVYARPLEEEEITSHYEFVRPQIKTETSTPTAGQDRKHASHSLRL